MNAPILTRRGFTGGLGTLVVAFSLDPNLVLAQERLPGSLQNNRKLDGWIRINPDGTATVFTGKVELGQGILTALAQIAAEEIDLPLARVRMISGDTRQTPNEGQTAGSQSVENSGTALRMAFRRLMAAKSVTPNSIPISIGKRPRRPPRSRRRAIRSWENPFRVSTSRRRSPAAWCLCRTCALRACCMAG